MEPEAAVLSAPDVSEQEMKGAIPKTAMKNNMHRRTPEETESVCPQQSSSEELVKKDIQKQQIACDIENTTQMKSGEDSLLSLISEMQRITEAIKDKLFSATSKTEDSFLQAKMSDMRAVAKIKKEELQLFKKDETATEKGDIESTTEIKLSDKSSLRFKSEGQLIKEEIKEIKDNLLQLSDERTMAAIQKDETATEKDNFLQAKMSDMRAVAKIKKEELQLFKKDETATEKGTMSLKGEHSSRKKYYQDGPLYRKLDDLPDDGVSNWRNCIKSKNAAKANRLLQEGSLPDPDELQEAYIAFKDEDQVLVKEMCHNVEEYISQIDDCIVYTQASYQQNRPEKVIFVVYTTDAKGSVLNIKYPCQVREIGRCNEEGDTIIAREKQENLTFGNDDYQELAFCLRMHSPDLMEKHSNLMNTSISHFKSSKEHGLIRKPCIVLYVSAKGFIPVCEEALPKTLMKQLKVFPTDIREGRFASPTGGPTEEHKDLKCGCRIESARLPGEGGTIGGFVNHPEHGLCAITCAHVVLDISECDELLKGTSDVKKFIGIQCFQPEPPSICGEVVDLRLFPGTDSKDGMDVAFVKVDEGRYPKSEAFPDILKGDVTDKRNSSLGALLKRKLKYDNSAVIQDAEEVENGKTVVKYGCTTNLTSGIIAASGTSVKLHLKGNYFTKGQPPILKTKTVRYNLNDQIEIHDDGMNFSKAGDSGSMVFITDKHNKLTALGILTGREVRGNKSYATPIWRVFEEIKSPIPYSLAEISNPVHQLLERLDQYSDQISKLQKSLDDLKEGAVQKT